MLLAFSCPSLAELPPWRFAPEFKPDELGTPELARDFLRRYVAAEAPFFAAARHPESGLTYDGWDLDPKTGEPLKPRKFSAASKECLDLALCVKGLYADPWISLVISPQEPEKAPEVAAEILARKLASYQAYEKDFPGFRGYFTWFKSGEKAEPMGGWSRALPTLDLGEMLWALLLVEKGLRDNGFSELAVGYAAYNERLRSQSRSLLWHSQKRGVRGRVQVSDPKDPESTFAGDGITTGEHGVHEGQMIVLYATLFGDLTPQERDEVWDGIRMVRVEHRYGTTWQGFWGSAHEEWAYLFLPYFELPEWRKLFSNRQKIRTKNAAERGYRGLAASAHHPRGEGYMSALGIEGVGSQPLEFQEYYTPYGCFPVMLDFAQRSGPNPGLAWLHSSLEPEGMQGPFGAGESADHGGMCWAPVKTIDASFTTLLALSGGLQRQTAELLREKGVYEQFLSRMRGEYQEAFGEKPLREAMEYGWPPHR